MHQTKPSLTMLAGARMIQEKQNIANGYRIMERSNSQLQIAPTTSNEVKINAYIGSAILDNEEAVSTSTYSKNLPVISESTEKLCTLKLKQFGQKNHFRANDTAVLKSCIIESSEEDFASTKNNIYQKVLASQQPLSANNKKIAENSQSSFSLLNYFIKSK